MGQGSSVGESARLIIARSRVRIPPLLLQKIVAPLGDSLPRGASCLGAKAALSRFRVAVHVLSTRSRPFSRATPAPRRADRHVVRPSLLSAVRGAHLVAQARAEGHAYSPHSAARDLTRAT